MSPPFRYAQTDFSRFLRGKTYNIPSATLTTFYVCIYNIFKHLILFSLHKSLFPSFGGLRSSLNWEKFTVERKNPKMLGNLIYHLNEQLPTSPGLSVCSSLFVQLSHKLQQTLCTLILIDRVCQLTIHEHDIHTGIFIYLLFHCCTAEYLNRSQRKFDSFNLNFYFLLIYR